MTIAEQSQRTSSSYLPPNFVVEPRSLQEHVLGTYLNLRYGIAVLGFALPIILWGVGLMLGIHLQGSISAYYYATATDPVCTSGAVTWPAGTLRNEFVGILIAVGAFLYLYKGFSRSENIALNLAGVFAVGVALVPTTWPPCQPDRVTVHGALAVLFFLAIAYVCLFRARDTLSLIDDADRRAMYTRWYSSLGTLMVVSPLAAVIFSDFFPGPDGQSPRVFFVEAFGVWTFAAYWLVKSLELRDTSAERRAISGTVARAKRHRRVLPDEAAILER